VFGSVRLQDLRCQDFLIPISPDFSFEEDFDYVEPFWMFHYPVNEGYADAWHWSEEGGSGSGGMVFGGPDSAQSYPSSADAAFELPLMSMHADAVLTLRHRMNVEEDYDGGVVEVNRGEGWRRVTPEEGYNGQAEDNGSFPGGPCWNGLFGWTEARLRLGGPAGPLRIRFRFGSDNVEESDGWFIDSIAVIGTPQDVPIETAPPEETVLTRVYPNPFNGDLRVEYSLPVPGRVSLLLIDAAGRRVTGRSDGFKSAGNHSTILDGSVLSTGLYLLRLQAGGVERTVKVVLVR